LQLPKRVFAHGWWTNEGKKISKSVGNVIDPLELIETYGLDPVRYFLLREVPFGNDGDFSRQSMISRINSDLSNDLGNLTQRVLTLVYKNSDKKIPQPAEELDIDNQLLNSAYNLMTDIRLHFDAQEFNSALEKIWSVISASNRYIDDQAPWALKKTDPERMNTVLYTLMEVLRYLAIIIQPVIPHSASKILDQLSVSNDERNFSHLNILFKLTPGKTLQKPTPVFPRFVLET
jgi:methionyl-tRNA synthetase